MDTKGLIQVLQNRSKIVDSQAFERLGKRMKVLEKEEGILNRLKEEIKSLKKSVDPTIFEAQLSLKKFKIEFLGVLLSKYKLKSLSRDHNFAAEHVFKSEISKLENFGIDRNSDDIKALVQEFEKISYSKISKTDRQISQAMMDNFTKHAGLDDIPIENLHNPEFIDAFINEQRAKFEEEQKRYEEEQKMVKIEDTLPDFKSLFKKLVVLLHPDKAKTEKQRIENESRIKELNAAWEERDYNGLIRIWITCDPENNCGFQLSDDNLQSLLIGLSDKIEEVEYEKYDIKESFEYHFYKGNFGSKSEKGLQKKVNEFKKKIEFEQSLTDTLTSSYSNTKEMKSYLSRVSEMLDEFWYDLNDFDLLGDDDEDDNIFNFDDFKK